MNRALFKRMKIEGVWPYIPLRKHHAVSARNTKKIRAKQERKRLNQVAGTWNRRENDG